MNVLRRVWSSTQSLHERFGVFPPKTVQVIPVFLEECRELVQAALLENEQQVAREAADVIVTVLGMCMARGVTLEAVEAAMWETAVKNDGKTRATHSINSNGKIARKEHP